MLPQLGRVERDAHRHALDDLDPVSRGVLRGKEREGAAGAGAESGELAVIGDRAAIRVGDELHRLARAQIRQLAFLEIRVHPDLVERYDRHQRRAGADALAYLHRAPGNEPGYRCRKRGARIRQIGLADLGRSLLHVRMSLDRRVVGERALRVELPTGRLERGVRAGDGITRVLYLLGGDGAGNVAL